MVDEEITDTESKKGKKASVLIYKHSEEISIEKDSTCYVLNQKNKQRYYPTLHGAFDELSKVLFVDKMSTIPDEMKTSIAAVIRAIEEHDREVKRMFRGY